MTDHDEMTPNDTQHIKRQETLQDGLFSMLDAATDALGDVGDKHEVLFVGNTVVNCRKLAGKLNMQPGFLCHYEELGEKVPHDIETIVLATHDPVILTRVKEKSNGASVIVMTEGEVPSYVGDLFPDHFLAWNTSAAFGHITKASTIGS